MTHDLSVEATGETVGEAKWAAVRELERLAPGVDRTSVQFQVVSEGERGLLGVGYTPARVLATAAAPRARSLEPDDSDAAAMLRGFLNAVAAATRVPVSIEIADDGDTVTATISGSDVSVLIGRHGQMLDALQYLANAIAARQGLQRRVVIDAAGYRARRASTLEALARQAAERASATDRPVSLEPMSAVERKVVHEALQDDPEVETTSEGAEPNRYVVILPRRAV